MNDFLDNNLPDQYHKVAEEYAAIQSQAFAEWAASNDWVYSNSHDSWHSLRTNTYKTTSELYQEFLKQNK